METMETPSIKITKVQTIQHERGEHKKVRIYIFPEGETILENLIERHYRPSKLWRPFAEQALQMATGESKKYKLSWSQKAGCSCGCSPGFIVSDLQKDYSVYVDIKVKN